MNNLKEKSEEYYIDLFLKNKNYIKKVIRNNRIYSSLKKRYCVDDIFQEAYLVFRKKLQYFMKSEMNVSFDLFINHNIISETLKDLYSFNFKVQKRNLSLEEPFDYSIHRVYKGNTEISDIENSELINNILSSLSNQDEKNLLRMRFIEDKSNKEIAEILGISFYDSTMKVLRLVRKLKERYKGIYEDF